LELQKSLPLHADPAFDLEEFDKRKKKLSKLADKTLNKPAPKKEEKKEEPKPASEANPEPSQDGANKDENMKEE